MKARLLLIFISFILGGIARAVTAYPYKIAVVQNGVTKYIRLFGDENCKRAESESGYTIIQNRYGQWCYAKINDDSKLVPSEWLLETSDNNPGFKTFIENTPKHISCMTKSRNKGREYTEAADNKVTGQRKVLVILMEYRDLAFSKKKNDFERLFNEVGYHDDSAQGSVKDFYTSASYGQLQLNSDVYGPYTTLHDMSYYGRNDNSFGGGDMNAYALFEEAITNIAKETELTQYDGDGDGILDNVHIIFAGYGEEAGATSDAIWSHEATFRQPYEIQGIKIDRYSCAPELRGNQGKGISRIGPHCHEIGHALGAMDYYDTDYATGGEYSGTGKWDVMASGSWNNEGITPADFNPYVKAFNYGWISPKSLPSGEVTICPSYQSPDNYYLLRENETGDFYMLENRSTESWGAGIPGNGLLIYHIHHEIDKAGNTINATAPQKCYIICASSHYKQPNITPASYGDVNSAGCPFPGITSNSAFGNNTVPAAFYWKGGECGINIRDITMTPEGNIVMLNESTDLIAEPNEVNSLFSEGFESTSCMKSFEYASPMWSIETNDDNPMNIVDKPVACNGNRCLQLSARNLSEDITGILEFACVPDYSQGRLRLKISYSSMFQSFSTPNIVRIGFRTKDVESWQYTELPPVSNGQWKNSVIAMPDDILPVFRIECTAYNGSILAIDDIAVEQEIKGDVTIVPECIALSREYIYTINGLKCKKPRRGLYLTVQPDGTYKKVFVK